MTDIRFKELSDMIFRNKSDDICRFVGDHSDSVRLRSDDGDTVLHMACWATRLDAVLAILGAGSGCQRPRGVGTNSFALCRL